MYNINKLKKSITALVISLSINSNFAQNSFSGQVGDVKMYKTENIIQNLCKSKEFTKLMSSLIKSDVDSQLLKEGNFTFFAPTNEAFTKLNKTTADYIFNPENKNILANVMNNHIVLGKLNTETLDLAIMKGNGKGILKTLSGNIIYIYLKNDEYYISDDKGIKSKLVVADLAQSNGVMHVIDCVLLPGTNP